MSTLFSLLIFIYALIVTGVLYVLSRIPHFSAHYKKDDFDTNNININNTSSIVLDLV